jgi:hypothetical protein
LDKLQSTYVIASGQLIVGAIICDCYQTLVPIIKYLAGNESFLNTYPSW